MSHLIGFIAAFATISTIVFGALVLFRDWFEYMEIVDEMGTVIRRLEREWDENCGASTMSHEDSEEQS